MILFLISNGWITKAQIITTFAGNGSTGYSGDGGPATAANIGHPSGCAFDSHGNFYFGGGGAVYDDVVRKVTPCGIISTVAGTGVVGYNGDGILATTAQLRGCTGLAFDAYDNLYIADVLNYRVRKVDAITGLISTVAGTGTAGYSGDGGGSYCCNVK